MSIHMVTAGRLAIVLLLQVIFRQTYVCAADSVPTVDGVDLELPATAFGGAIEGAAVNAQGDVFATDFVGSGAAASMAFGFFHRVQDGTASVLDLNVNPRLTAAQGEVAKLPLLNGARFLPADRLLLADAANKRVVSVQDGDPSIFCTDQRMLQPNDLAVSVVHPTLIYLSGQNYSADTTAGASGDLWTCDGGNAILFPTALLAGADIHRTNGIETSPCGKFLYLSSAKNVAGAVVANRIMRFVLDPNTGALVQEQPTVFFDFTGDGAAVDIDGMRTDVEGNLFVTRNGKGQVFKISPEGQLLMIINLPGMGGPSNLEFGGAEGKTLFAVGKCAANATAGCAASFEAEHVGKAFKALH